MNKQKQAVLITFGEGGHNAEMRQLLNVLNLPSQDEVHYIGIVDSAKCHLDILHLTLVGGVVRDKLKSFSLFTAIKVSLKTAIKLVSILRSYRCKLMISTGPGINIVPAVIMRLCGKPVIHVETACRFTTASINGRIMYRLATHFYVQNKEQLELYPKAVWSGRL